MKSHQTPEPFSFSRILTPMATLLEHSVQFGTQHEFRFLAGLLAMQQKALDSQGCNNGMPIIVCRIECALNASRAFLRSSGVSGSICLSSWMGLSPRSCRAVVLRLLIRHFLSALPFSASAGILPL